MENLGSSFESSFCLNLQLEFAFGWRDWNSFVGWIQRKGSKMISNGKLSAT